MPAPTIIRIVTFTLCFIAFGQASIAQSLDSLNHKIDSIQQRINNIANPDLNKTDKLTSKVNNVKLEKPDSLRAVHDLDSMKRGLTTKIDSLKGLNLPTDRYSRKLDSLNQIGPQKYIDMVNSKMGLLNKDLNLNADLNTNLKLDTDIKTKLDVNPPNADLPKANLQEMNVPKVDIPKPGSIDQLNDAKEKLGDLNQTTDKVQSYQGEVKNITEGKIDDVKQLPDAIENKASQLDEVKELQKQTGEMDKAKGMIGKQQDPDALKDMAKTEIKQQAIDHFKGQEQALKAAMDKMSKLKEKYPSVTSMKDLPKRVPNPMKGKPLIERIVPGVTLQVQKSQHVMIDLNPVVSYRFTGRINAGLGWNERFVFTKWNKLSHNERIYGPRVFGSFAFKKGFAAKAEIEKMNALIPAAPFSSDGTRQWVWSAFVGLKKDYKFIGKVKGNVQVLYNLYDDHDNSPYSDRLNVRMGFEFPMKKHKKPQNQAGK